MANNIEIPEPVAPVATDQAVAPPPPQGAVELSTPTPPPPPAGAQELTPETAKPAPQAQPDAAQPSMWEKANTGVVAPNTIAKAWFGRDESVEDAQKKATRDPDEYSMNHPYLDAMYRFFEGSRADIAKTASSFTSPTSLALTLASGAGEAAEAFNSLKILAMGEGVNAAAEAINIASKGRVSMPLATQVAKIVAKTNKIAQASKVAAPAAKTLQTAAGAGFAGAGVDQALEHGDLSTPEGVQNTLQGLGMAAGGAAGAADGIKDAAVATGSHIASKLRPTEEQVGNTSVPVRARGLLAKAAQKTVDMQEFAATQTGPAVAKGIGDVAKSAVGTVGETAVSEKDPMGLLGHAKELETKSQPLYKKIDEWSDGKVTEYQNQAANSFGRDEAAYQEAKDAQDALFNVYKKKFPNEAAAVDEMQANWRRKVALEDINKVLGQSTTGSEYDGQAYRFKQGRQLSNGINQLIRNVENGKNAFDRAGFTPEHVAQLKQFGDIIREEGAVPKFNKLMGLMVRVGLGVTGHIGGMFAEAGGEKAGAWMANRLFSKVLTTPEALKAVNTNLHTNQPVDSLAGSGWFKKIIDGVKAIHQDESGEFVIPGTGTAGTAAAAAKDTEYGKQAVDEVAKGRPYSELSQAERSKVMQRAQQLKESNGPKPTSLDHWSNAEGLTETDPEKFGSGKMGEERKRASDPDFVPRTYFGMGSYKEPSITGQAHAYKANVDLSKYYDIQEDKHGIWQEAYKDGGATAAEKAVKDAGYSGYHNNDVLASFDKVPVKPNSSVAEHANQFNRAEGRGKVSQEKTGADIRGHQIADAYEEMEHTPNDYRTRKSYEALKDDARKQWDYIENKMGIKIEPSDTDPYKSHEELMKDVQENHHLSVWRGGNPLPSDHPLAAVDPKIGENYNTIFRAVHDLFGHVAGENDFSETGEENAWNAHRQMMSPDAIPAMTSETKGQTSWFYNHKGARNGGQLGQFAEQKAGLLPESLHSNMDEQKVLDHIKSGKDFAILQAENPKNQRISDAENAKRNEKLVKDLRDRGYDPVPVGGNTKDVEGVTEHAFFVPDMPPHEAAELGRKYQQMGILTNEGLHDLNTDMVAPSDNKNLKFDDAARNEQYFTTVGKRDFNVPLDFNNQRPAAENGLLSSGGLTKAGQKAMAKAQSSPYKPVESFADVAEFLPESDLARLTKRMQDGIVRQLKVLGDPQMIEEAAKAGSIQRGWYKRTGDLIRGMFGDDAKTFTDIFAAMSPLKTVEQNFIDAFDFYGDWVKEGKPTGAEGKKAIAKLLKGRDLGLAGENIRNGVQDILEKGAEPSGAKVSNFAKNIKGEMDAVTKDRWIAYLLGQKAGYFKGLDKGAKPGANYLASDIMIRRVAKNLNMLPAEVQESGWSFLRTALNMAEEKGITPDESARTVTESDIRGGSSEFTRLISHDTGIRVALNKLAERTGNESFRPENIEGSGLYQNLLAAAESQQPVAGGLAAAHPEILARTAERAADARSGITPKAKAAAASGDTSFDPNEM